MKKWTEQAYQINATSDSECVAVQSWEQPLREERRPFTNEMRFIKVNFAWKRQNGDNSIDEIA